MGKNLIDEILRSAIDLHFHIGPEFVKRKYDMDSLAEELQGTDMGIVIKNHCYSTTPIASTARKKYGIKVYGSIVLNRYVGGVNKYAIESAISGNKGNVQNNDPDEEKFVVWMPTVHAGAHIKEMHYDFDPAWGVDEKYCNKDPEGIVILDEGELTLETLEVLESVKKYDLVLATGHLSSEETIRLVEESNRMGIERLILTHPFYKPTGLNIEKQKYLAGLGAFVEHTYGVCLIDKIPLGEYAESIREIGADRTILSTDLGQISNKNLTEGFREFLYRLNDEESITPEEIKKMVVENPRRLMER